MGEGFRAGARGWGEVMRVILFDIDGTLLVSRGIGRAAKGGAMLECFGLTGDLDNHVFGGKTDWGILAELLAPYGYSSAEIGRRMGEYEAALARHMRAIRPNFTAQPTVNAMELVHCLRQRDDMLVGLVTGNTEQTARVKLEMARFDPDWFRVGAFGHESPRRADLTRLAKARARQAIGRDLRGKQVVVVGDTPADIAAARAIDALAVAVETGYATRADLAACQPDLLLTDLSGFMDALPP